jgi:ribosomal protein L17
MKLYTDFSGKFQMYIPLNWEYKNPSFHKQIKEGTPQAFGFYDKSIGAFQLSCKKINDHINNLISSRREPIQSSDAERLHFSEQFINSGEFDVYVFSCAVDDHYFLATYTVESKMRPNEQIEIELNEARKALSSLKFIKEPYRQTVLDQRRFDLFMSAIATIMDLKDNAVKKESFIEYVVFSANHIDALLRLSIILTNQLKNNNEEIEIELLFQNETDKPIMERTIYQRCLDQNIISKSLFDKLEELYKERNKVIHRFIITDIRTEDILNLALEYQNVFDDVETIILSLEEKQTKLGVGVWGHNLINVPDEYERQLLKSKIRDKHGRLPTSK